MELFPVSISSKNNLIVSQSNYLTEARYSLSVAEQRLIITLLSFISPSDEDFKDYEIKISDFKEIIGIKSNTVYSNIRYVLRSLQGRVIEIPKTNEMIGWFSYSRYIEESGTIIIRFDKALKPHLLSLKEQFTQYKIFIVAQFQSYYTIRIYTLLKQYEFLGERDIKLIELREILGINKNQYPKFYDFRRRIINQAKREFETLDKETGAYKSDITFDLETFRTGRKITDLKFIIKKQKIKETRKIEDPLAIKPAKESTPEAEIKKPNPIPQTLSPTVEALSRHNISEVRAKTFEEEQGEEAILNCIKLYEEKVAQGKVNDKTGGYLISMLEAKAGIISQAEIEAEQQKKEEQRLRILKEQEQRLEEYKHKVTVHFERGIKKQFLADLSPQQKESLWQEIEPQLKYKISTNLVDKGNELENPFVGVELNKRIPNYEERKANYINLKMAQKRQELFGNIDDF